jgi:hypothetical protein
MSQRLRAGEAGDFLDGVVHGRRAPPAGEAETHPSLARRSF